MTMTEREFELRMNVVDALESLLERNSLEHVKVSEICKAATCSPGTFYRYFSGKYAVAEWVFSFYAFEGTRSLGRTMRWRESNALVLDAMIRHRALFRESMRLKGVSSFRRYAIQLFIETMSETLFVVHAVPYSDHLAFQVEYMGYAMPTMVCEWFVGGMPFSSEKLLDYLDNITSQPLYALVNKLASTR